MSSRAVQQVHLRKIPPGSYYASIAKRYPVMQKYENNEPAYFTTPPTQLIRALHATLSQITARPIAERIAIHGRLLTRLRLLSLGLV
ncbi:hypothetical protein DTO013E5_843 [Penicillium roqueforti]|nr:hypothetical protein CBS147337_1687 [Penicillium roqueforti]KAI2721593.1 hypothetical protein CBS147318_2208 [Penicillium roqueforti]KAI2728263.1 hypothetical protein CBS147354_2796 [Penicillium roqueforti]KAI2747558.1 hypothetical protein DTO012A1_204 [Penicillium roqueforti]KAI2750874.1 hypothetical protein DTO013F2_4125 [Penicillium roqueforti]